MTATILGRLVGVVGLLLAFSFTCSAQRKKNTHPAPTGTQPAVVQPHALTVVNEKLGPNPDKSANKDNSFTLYRKDTTNVDNGMPLTKYLVIRNDDQRVVEEGSFTMGVIDWSADYELQITSSTGAAQSQAGNSKRKIDLRPYLKRQ